MPHTPRSLRNPGESNRWDKPYRVLTNEDVTQIRQLATDGLTHVAIGAQFDVDPSHISRIVRGQRRKRNR